VRQKIVLKRTVTFLVGERVSGMSRMMENLHGMCRPGEESRDERKT